MASPPFGDSKPAPSDSEHMYMHQADQVPNLAERQLPPVKPPTAGLLMQLFFIPMVIVAVIVAVFLMFGWLTESGRKPSELADDLEKLNLGSRQKAFELTLRLRERNGAELRRSEQLAEQLSTTLTKLLPRDDEKEGSEIQLLQVWLCQALGQFEIDQGLPALVEATESRDLQVRRSAVQALGLLASHIEGNLIVRHEGLLPALRTIGLSRPEGNEDETIASEIRSSTAFTLGLLGADTSARDVLAMMLADPHPDVRFNAATGLARHHDTRAVDRLVEMIQLNNAEVAKYELAAEKVPSRSSNGDSRESSAMNQEKLVAWKQDLVIEQGLNAIDQLYDRTPRISADDSILESLGKLTDTPAVAWRLRNLAGQLRDKLVQGSKVE